MFRYSLSLSISLFFSLSFFLVSSGWKEHTLYLLNFRRNYIGVRVAPSPSDVLLLDSLRGVSQLHCNISVTISMNHVFDIWQWKVKEAVYQHNTDVFVWVKIFDRLNDM